jgi:uncharacterized repeat protein (TIGR03803 family)
MTTIGNAAKGANQMNSLTLSRCALSVCAAATLLVGCGGLQPAGVTQGPVPQGQMPENLSRVTGVGQSPRSVRHPSVTETVLHSFGAGSYGDSPVAGLTYFKGTLYGTTLYVECGSNRQCTRGARLRARRGRTVATPNTSSFIEPGTVYRITLSGTYKVLHYFLGGYDGAYPEARLIVLKGALYGTTDEGGDPHAAAGGPCSQLASGFGTVFSITPSGGYAIVHTFIRSRDGWYPQAALLNVNGTLYGTTCGGGGIGGGNGTAFTITPSGHEHMITSFQLAGGAPPSRGRLVDLNGTLYGTASGGGKYGEGAVFSLSTSGREKLLYSFKGSSKDGADPEGGLTAIKHTLYGTTKGGGAYGDGTMFSITPTGKETVLYSFTGSDGSGPVATLLNVNGTLYGTTSFGGAYNYGTVFSITLSGHETVLHSFDPNGSGFDGADPESGVIDVNGTLYGTTYGGGQEEVGTVYSITL